MPPQPRTVNKNNYVTIRVWTPRKWTRVCILREAQAVPSDHETFSLRLGQENFATCSYKENGYIVTQGLNIRKLLQHLLQQGLKPPEAGGVLKDQRLIDYLSSEYDVQETDKVGHVSLETASCYVSFWPKLRHYDPDKPDPQNDYETSAYFYQKVNDSYLRTLKYDRQMLRKMAYVEETLYTLDVVAINQAFLRFKELNFKWELWGGSIFASESTQNCSGLVSFLLGKGEISRVNTRLPSLFKGAGCGAVGGAVVGLALPTAFSWYRSYKINTTPSTGDRDMTTNAGLTATFFLAMVTALPCVWRVAKENKGNILTAMILGSLIGAATGFSLGTTKVTDSIATVPTDVMRIVKTSKQIENNKYALTLVEDIVPGQQYVPAGPQ